MKSLQNIFPRRPKFSFPLLQGTIDVYLALFAGTAGIIRNIHADIRVHRDYFSYMAVHLSIRAGDGRKDLGGDTDRIAGEALTMLIDSRLRHKLFNKEFIRYKTEISFSFSFPFILRCYLFLL